jgi:uncharacterized protein YqjF (DUF2071 family)
MNGAATATSLALVGQAGGRKMTEVPISPIAPPLPGPTLSAQRWADLTFLHWPIDPDSVAQLMPPGVRPDVIDGVSYVGLVPFTMRGAGPSRLPVPYFGTFCETNVRLYSVDESGRHGIVFLTLDAARLATVLLARLSLGLPYAWSRMGVQRHGDLLTYRGVRRWPDRARRAGGTISVQIGEPAVASPVEMWLTSRWGLHTRVAGQTVWVPNRHGPWPLRLAELRTLESDLVAACGIELEPASMLRPLWSPGVRTSFGLPSRVT